MIAHDPIERMGEAERRAWIDARLAERVAHARAHSPFYREHLAGVTVSGLADLETLPVLEKGPFMAASPPDGEGTLTGPMGGAYVFRSGGSTGDPKFSLYAHGEFRRLAEIFLRTYGAAGLRPEDRVGNLFASGSLYASFVFVNRLLEEMGCLSFPFSNTASPEVVARHVRMFGINVLVGFPSWLLQVAGAIAQEGLRVEKIFYAGEHLYDEERRYLEEALGCTLIASAGYGAVDTGLMGYQCDRSGGRVHHVHSDHVILEFVDPETHAPVPPGVEGLILVTNLDRALQPVIRYNIGDLGRWVEGPCPCGRTTPRFELLGRGDDALRIGYASLTYDEVSQAFVGVPELTATIQMVKEREAHKDKLRFRIEVPAPEALDHQALGQRLSAVLASAKPDIGKLLETGYIQPLAFEFLPPGGIPRVAVTGKLKRTLDLST